MTLTRRTLRYVTQDIDICNAEAVMCEYEKIMSLKPDNATALAEAIEHFYELTLLTVSKYLEYVSESSCNTADANISAQLRDYATHVFSLRAKYAESFRKFVLSNPHVDALPNRFSHLKAVYTNLQRLDSESDAPNRLNTEINQLANTYNTIFGTLKAVKDDVDIPITALLPDMLSTDESARKAAFLSFNGEYLGAKRQFDELFDKLLKKRIELVKILGFSDYVDYAFVLKQRFGYTRDDAKLFYEGVKTVIAPMLKRFNLEKAAKLGKTALSPWDERVNPFEVIQLDYEDEADFLTRARQIFADLDGDFARWFDRQVETNTIDLMARMGKAQGGFNAILFEYLTTFTFANCNRTVDDLRIGLHEFGHAFHAMAAMENNSLLLMDGVQGEIAELASLAMEFLCIGGWHYFITDSRKLKEAKRDYFLKFLNLMVKVSSMDEFQTWIYEHPNATATERDTAMCAITDAYDIGFDWRGYEEYKPLLWYQAPHAFVNPLNVIDYGIAYLGAFSLYYNYKRNPKETIAAYKMFLKNGFENGVAASYELANIKLDMSAGHMKNIVALIEEELG